MDRSIFLPDIAEVEVRVMVPPKVQKLPQVWSRVLDKICSLFKKKKKKTKYHIVNGPKVGNLPISLIGCDIKSINFITIAPEDERRD